MFLKDFPFQNLDGSCSTNQSILQTHGGTYYIFRTQAKEAGARPFRESIFFLSFFVARTSGVQVTKARQKYNEKGEVTFHILIQRMKDGHFRKSCLTTFFLKVLDLKGIFCSVSHCNENQAQ